MSKICNNVTCQYYSKEGGWSSTKCSAEKKVDKCKAYKKYNKRRSKK